MKFYIVAGIFAVILAGFAYAYVETGVTDNSYIVYTDLPINSYSITAGQLRQAFSEVDRIENYGSQWVIHFNQNNNGRIQAERLAEILADIDQTDGDRYILVDGTLTRCTSDWEFNNNVGGYIQVCR